MFANEDEINLRLAKSHAENVLSVINVDWEDKDIVDMMTASAQDKSIEILGEKARQNLRLLQRYVMWIDWRILAEENISYFHPSEEVSHGKTLEEKEYLLYQFIGEIENALSINKNISETHKNRLENVAEWVNVSQDLLAPNIHSEETKDTILFLSLTYSIQLAGEYLGRINRHARSLCPEIEWEKWIGYSSILAHKIENTDIDGLTKETIEAAPLLLEGIQSILASDANSE